MGPAWSANLDITGPPARVRFLDAADAEHAVLEGGEGWLNATAQVAAHDFITSTGVSLEALHRQLEEVSLADLQAVIVSQQATIASQQATITSLATSSPLASFVSNGLASGDPPGGKLWVAYCARRTQTRCNSVWGALLHGECMATNNGTGWWAPGEPSILDGSMSDVPMPPCPAYYSTCVDSVLDGITPDGVRMVEWQYTLEYDASRVVLGKPEGNPPAGKVWVAHCLRRLQAEAVRTYSYWNDPGFHGPCAATNNGSGWWAYNESEAGSVGAFESTGAPRYGSPLDGDAPTKILWHVWLYTLQYEASR